MFVFDNELLLVTVQQLFVAFIPFSCRGETSAENVIFEKHLEKKKLIFTPLIIQFKKKSVGKQVYMAHNFIINLLAPELFSF